MSDELFRVQRIVLEGLYGIYNHTVSLNAEERITIIHGPNGVGKTALLRLIYNISKGKYFACSKINFEKLALYFDEGSVLTVSSIVDEAPKNDSLVKTTGFNIYLRDNNSKELHTHQLDLVQGKESQHLLSVAAKVIPWLSRLSDELWVDERTGVKLDAEEVINTYGDRISSRTGINLNGIFSEPEWLSSFRKKISIHLIETQRLIQIDNTEIESFPRRSNQSDTTVKNYADDLRRRINEAMTDYGKIAQELDQSMPKRLLSGSIKALSSEELKRRMEDIAQERENFQEFGLMGKDSDDFNIATLDNADETQKKVMTLYVNDAVKKFEKLNDLVSKLKLLRDAINAKFRNKKIAVDSKSGLIVLDNEGREFPLDALSSGEQHELVLMYDLLFRVSKNSLVMIDEPELSLHLSWQKKFIGDLKEIVAKSEFDAILATHSPFIAEGNSHLMVSLLNKVR